MKKADKKKTEDRDKAIFKMGYEKGVVDGMQRMLDVFDKHVKETNKIKGDKK